MKVKTERFYLRPLNQSDATERYLSWLAEEAKKEFILSAASFQTIESIKSYIQKLEDSQDGILFGIFTPDDEHIGNIKYNSISKSSSSAVMGIMIGQEEWRGKGVASEVIIATSKSLRDEKGIESIILGVKTKNTAAIRAYEKIGFEIVPDPVFENGGEAQKMVLKTKKLV
ncbi:MAG: GNAT family N-acetyltransferase [Bdellovibrionota bacterium]|nr:GNAT family N-acetyltransferase [Bdellovibrionota bacterium]